MSKSLRRREAGLALMLCVAFAAALLATAVPALAETCPNEEFRTGSAAHLPDCRAYELVTPPFKEASLAAIRGSIPVGGFGLAGVSASGSRVDVVSLGDFGDAQNGLQFDTYQLTRTESGWGEVNIDLPASPFIEQEPLYTTPEMDATLYEARTAEQPLKAKDFWLREADGVLRDIGPFEPPADTEGPTGPGGQGSVQAFYGGFFISASKDLSHVLFTSEVSWPGDEAYGAAGGSLYEYLVGRGGPPVPVGVEPGGAYCPATFPAFDGISADGSTVVFTCGGQIFARIDNGEAGARTVAISEPSAADCSACDTSAGVRAEAEFGSVSADGSKIVFTTTQPLLGGDQSRNVYEYDFGAPQASAGDPDGRIVQVSGGSWGPGGAQVQLGLRSSATTIEFSRGIIVSEDGSHVYFVAEGALGGAVNRQGQSPQEGSVNLYVFERDAQFPAGRLSFIAVVQISRPGRPGEQAPSTTPDGRFFVFASSTDLTPGDTSTARQVFEYDAQTGELVRCSIGQDGFNDNGNTDIFDSRLPWEEMKVTDRMPRAVVPLAVSNDGAYVVFQSADGLTPGALNGATNVYEYHHGNVYLISDGLSSASVEGMSPSGDDIYFETEDQLVPQDLDTEGDTYDARVNGGFPAPVSLLPSCTGDACQGELSGAPVLLSPGSEFQAGGNPPLAAPKPIAKAKPKVTARKACRKGLRRKRGRCVAKKKAKRAAKSARGRR